VVIVLIYDWHEPNHWRRPPAIEKKTDLFPLPWNE
jgi:hypothetical protein